MSIFNLVINIGIDDIFSDICQIFLINLIMQFIYVWYNNSNSKVIGFVKDSIIIINFVKGVRVVVNFKLFLLISLAIKKP